MAVPPTSMDDKQSLRAAMRQRRAAFVAGLDPEARSDAEHALAVLVAPLLQAARVVATYSAVGDEIDPHRVAAACLVYPRVVRRGCPLTFHAANRTHMRAGWAGILEPAADAPARAPDALLMPLLAVDPCGVRLGQGAGYYDLTLAGLPGALKIGLAWDVQVVEALRADPWDVPLDWIATPTRLIRCGPGATARMVGAGVPSR
jgi:5-formyltetrahydrofolate cyclo-ligase